MALFKKSKDISVGVIGYGGAFNMGRAHLNEMKAAGMSPLAVAEPQDDRRKIAQEEFPGIETYASESEMLKKSDVKLIVIITPHDSHYPLTMQCLKANRHVVVEKPMALTTVECDKMIAEAKKRDLILSTYHNRHWDGSIIETLKEINKGSIGKPNRINLSMGQWHQPRDWWRSSKSISGGILYDWGVHLIEYSLQIINSEATEVFGYAFDDFWNKKASWKKDTIEDEAGMIIRFKNGMILDLRISNLETEPSPYFAKVSGTEGSIQFTDESIKIIKKKKNKTTYEVRENIIRQGEKFYQNIAEHLTKDTPLIITPEWARRMIHFIDLAQQSAQKGKTLKPKYG